MKHDQDSEALLIRYLLGDLSEEQNVEIEERAFHDREFMQTIQSVESDLIDEYVRGELSEREREQFESRFLASSEQEKKVEFAKTLANVLPNPGRDKRKAKRGFGTPHSRTPAHQVSPAPKAPTKIRDPSVNVRVPSKSASARSTDAAAVLPIRQMLTSHLSGSMPVRSCKHSIIRRFA